MKYLSNKPFPTGLYKIIEKEFVEEILKKENNESL